MNLRQIRDRVKVNLTPQFMLAHNITDDLIDEVINNYYTIIAFDSQVIKNNYQLTTVANQESYGLDNEFLLIERVHYDYISSDDWGKELIEVSKHYFEGDMEFGEPDYYWVEQPHTRDLAKIYFHPIPDSNGKIIRVSAIKYPELMVNDEDVPKLKGIFDIILIHGATMELGAIGEGIPNLQFYMLQYEKNLQKAKEILYENTRNRSFRTTYREIWD